MRGTDEVARGLRAAAGTVRRTALDPVLRTGESAWVLARAGVLRPYSPQVLRGLASIVRTWGVGPAGGFAAMALRDPDRACVVDENGTTTWGQMHRRGNSVARGLAGLGVRRGSRVGILCRNHRGFLDALVGASRLGADLVFLNTSMAAPQVCEVLQREGITAVVHDAEFTDLLVGAQADGVDVRLACSEAVPPDHPLESVPGWVAEHSDADLPPAGQLSRIILLTSGTTGTPKGAPRREAGPDAAVALLSRMPLRAGWRTHIAAPLFHTWGMAHLLLAMLLGSTVVLRRSFDPQACLETVAGEQCESLVVIPVMLQRMLRVPPEQTAHLDLSALRVVASSGSALPGGLALAWMDRFGETLHSIYGSTEVAYAAVATPVDLRADPTTAGRPPANTVVRVLGADGSPVAAGVTGRLFVGNSLLMPGYTHGDSKEMIGGLMSSGDLGRIDANGLVHVDGRDDEMIVSGGENVFPAEVEHCLAEHPWVEEAVAIGVPDDEFGQRLRAFVVLTHDGSSDPAEVATQLQSWVRERLARYKVPRDVWVLEELPRNATGKVLKRELVVRTRPESHDDGTAEPRRPGSRSGMPD